MRKFLRIFFIVLILSVIFFIIIGVLLTIANYIKWRVNRQDIINTLNKDLAAVQDTGRVYIDNDPELKGIPTQIFDRNGILIGEFSTTKRERLTTADIPLLLKKAVILMEDRKFYRHHGIDYLGILRAFIINIRYMKIKAGGSTLTQQLSKVLFTRHERTLGRKIYELFITREMERRLTKEQIFLLYINHIYLGHGCYGILSASRLYFEKEPKELNIYEISILAGMISSPNYYSPIHYPEHAKKKSMIVLKKLSNEGLVTASVINRAKKYFWPEYMKHLKKPNISFWKMSVNQAPYFNEYVRQILTKYFSEDRILRDGLKVYTTLDIRYDKFGRNSLNKGIELQDRYKRKKNVRAYNNTNKQKNVQGALISLKSDTGEILAMIGGRNYSFYDQLNRSIQIKRQVGSTIKPFIYILGFEGALFNQYTIMDDKKIRYRLYGKKYWSPENYSHKFYGHISIHDALIKSVNTIAVQVLSKVGPEIFIERIKKVLPNIIAKPYLSLALGTIELSPIELACLYSILANQGKFVKPYGIKRVVDRYGYTLLDFEKEINELYLKMEKNDNRLIYTPASAFVINNILKDDFSEQGTASWAARSKHFMHIAAGKTGTTDEYRDAWFAGYTPDITSVIWFGYDDQESLGKGRTGGVVAAPVWTEYMNNVLWNQPDKDFTLPNAGIIKCKICLDSYMKAVLRCTNTFEDYFVSGTEPKKCSIHSLDFKKLFPKRTKEYNIIKVSNLINTNY